MNTYQPEILQKKHRDQTITLITHTFCDYEPMAHYLNIPYQAFTPVATLMVDNAIQDQLGVVLLDQDQVIACGLLEDRVKRLDVQIEIDPRFNIIFTLLEQLCDDFFQKNTFEQGQLAHLFITAIDRHYFGKGLSSEINQLCMDLAEKKGYGYMYSEFTNYLNAKGTLKHMKWGYQQIGSCLYKEYVVDHQKPFEHLEDDASAYIWKLHA